MQAFHQFSRLPPELRSMIWEFAVFDEAETPGLHFFDLYSKPGYICACELCQQTDALHHVVSVPAYHSSKKIPRYSRVRPASHQCDTLNLQRRDRLVSDKFIHRLQRGTDLEYRIYFRDCRRALAALHPHHAGVPLESVSPDCHAYVRGEAHKQGKIEARPALLEHHGVAGQDLGVPFGKVLNSPGFACNPSAYLANHALWRTCVEARQAVRKLAGRADKDPKRSDIVSFTVAPPTGQQRPVKLFWNPRKDLICLRPETHPDGTFKVDLGDLADISLIDLLRLKSSTIELAIEVHPSWAMVAPGPVHAAVFKCLKHLAGFVAAYAPRSGKVKKVLYFINWGIKLRPGRRHTELGKPLYYGSGVNFYEVKEVNSPFEYPRRIGEWISALRAPEAIGRRRVDLKILAPVSTNM